MITHRLPPDSSIELTVCASIRKRHDAYLISWDHGEPGQEATPIELYDAASSLRRAREIAAKGAAEFGWQPPFHWVETTPEAWWELYGHWPTEEIEP